MFKTKTLLVIVFILGSAVVVKAAVFFSVSMPYLSDLSDPMGLP
jgi:hypothetical protein